MNRILVRAPNWIGDQVMAYPFYRELRRAYPKAWIAVVCTSWVADIQFKGLVDQVFLLPKKRGDSLLRRTTQLLRFASVLKGRGPWDLAISLPNSFGAALLLKRAGAVVRRGYDTDLRGWLLTDRVEWQGSADIHRSQAYLNLIPPAAAKPWGGSDARQYWTESNAAMFDPVTNWPEATPIEPPSEPYFIVAPGATADSRRWSTDQFAELIQKTRARAGWSAVIVGGPAEKRLAQEFIENGIPVRDYTALGTVAAHWKLFREAKFALCNESGLAHVAALCGTRVHIVCGAADPKRTRPIGPGPVQVTINPVECWPCERNLCRYNDLRHNQCLKGIEPERVLDEINAGFFNQQP